MSRTAFSRNIKELRNDASMTQEQLSDEIGVTVVTIHNWENGKSDKPRQSEVTEKLKDLFGVTDSDLFGFNDGYYAKKYGLTKAPIDAVAVRSTSARMVPICVLGAAHAGDPDEPWEFDGEAMLYEELAVKHPNCFALRVNGTCMNRNFTDKDTIFVDPEMKPKDGSIGVVCIDGETVVRRIRQGNSSLMLVAETTEADEWQDIIVQGDSHEVTPVGTVFWWQSGMEVD